MLITVVILITSYCFVRQKMKQILVSCFILVAFLLAFSYAQVATASPRVSLEPVVSNLTAVTEIRFAKPPGWSRSIMFIAEQTAVELSLIHI